MNISENQISAIKIYSVSLDRAHGKEFSQNFENSCLKLEEYVGCVEQELKDRAALIEALEEAEVFYDAQYGEAKIVTNVSFFSRLHPIYRLHGV